jgi:hypothetical protein
MYMAKYLVVYCEPVQRKEIYEKPTTQQRLISMKYHLPY